MKFKSFLNEKNIHTQVIDISNDKILQECRGNKKYKKFCDKYNTKTHVVQIIDIDTGKILQDNQ